MHEPASSGRRVRFGPFQLDVRSGELWKDAIRVKAPLQSIEILKALLERPGDLVTREQLRERLWPSDTFVDFEHGLNAAIRRLREALGDSADTPIYVETLPRRGYRFVGVIERESVSARRRTAMWRVPLLAALALAVATGGWMAHKRAGSAESTPSGLRSIPVTTFPDQEVTPSVSPDGNHVAFAWSGGRSQYFDIYVKLIDGGTPQPVTTDPAPDAAPAWSPDGKRIAFLRRTEAGGSVVIVVPAFGGPERRLDSTRTAAENGPRWFNGVSWTPDGQSVLFVDRASASTSYAVFLCRLETGERRQLTWPTRDFSDAFPRISPDGRSLAFVRRIVGASDGYVFMQPFETVKRVQDARRVTDDHTSMNFDWTSDSRGIVYDGANGLWRVSTAGGSGQPLLTNVPVINPSIARNGSRLLYQRSRDDSNIWRIPVPQSLHGERLAQSAPVRLIASTLAEWSPQFSPDGQRIAFASSRAGNTDIWVSAADGSSPMQLTSFGAYTGSPRWSADGNSIAFDSARFGSWNIYVVGSQGGAVRAVTSDASNNVRPSWSRDGRWIYFGSNRSGDWQIWKTASSGGSPTQVTKKGGLEAFESPDARHLYYAKPAEAPGIWEIPTEGGVEMQVLDHGRVCFFGVADSGILLMNPLAKPRATVEFFRFASRRLELVAELQDGLHFPLGAPAFAVSRDARWILYTTMDQRGSDIEMLGGFR